MVSDFSVGTLLAFAAAILFGVHTSFSKTKSVIESGVAMPIYNIYFLLGAAITNLIEWIIMIILGAQIEFTYLGIICAFLLLCFEVTLLLSIQQIGVGYATGFSVFSASIVTPILQVVLKQPIELWWVMVIGLVMLAFSVFTMSVLRDVLKCCGFHKSQSFVQQSQADEHVVIDHEQQEQIELQTEKPAAVEDATSVEQIVGSHVHGNGLMSVDEHTPLMHGANGNEAAQPTQEMQISRCSMILGLVFSSLAGIFMAVLPLPSLYAGPNSAGLNFFLSFGVGCLIVIPLSGVIAIFTQNGHDDHHGGTDTAEDGEAYGKLADGVAAGQDSASVIPYTLLYKLVSFDNEVWHFKEVVVPAVCAGVVWGIGNICGFCSFLYLSYTIAVSFVQCNVIVAMFLGVVMWKEITNKVEISILALLSLVLVAGCAVVVYGVFGSF